MEGVVFGYFHVAEVGLAVCEGDYDWGHLGGLGGREMGANGGKVVWSGRVGALAWGAISEAENSVWHDY